MEGMAEKEKCEVKYEIEYTYKIQSLLPVKEDKKFKKKLKELKANYEEFVKGEMRSEV